MNTDKTYTALQRRLRAEATVRAAEDLATPHVPQQAPHHQPPKPPTAPAVAVAVNEARASSAAVVWACREATDRHVPLLLLAADDGHLLRSHVEEHHVRHEVAELIVALQHEHPDLEIDAQVGAEKAGPFLVSATEHAQLLVLGSRRDHGLLGQRLGSTSAYCLAHATCPIVVVPETWTADRTEAAAARS